MKAERKLTVDELAEQSRLSALKEVLAYLKDGVPRSKKFDDALETLRMLNTYQQTKQGTLNNYTRLLQMLPAQERMAELLRIKGKLLPGESSVDASKS